MARIDFDLDDLTNAALKRLVKQLLVADDKEEQEILDRLTQDADKESDDLVALSEEKRGAPKKIAVEDDSPRAKKR